MKVRPSVLHQYFSGYVDGMVFSPYKDRFGINSMRKYAYPDELTSQNATFGAQCQAIASTWNDASEGFQADMSTYEDAWNDTQHEGKLPSRDVNNYALFIAACFGAGEVSSFDLSTLTVDNFGGEIGDLLGTEAPNVGNLITAGGLPACGLDLSTLNSSIETV